MATSRSVKDDSKSLESPVSKASQSIEALFGGEGETLSVVKHEKVLEKRIAFFSGASHEGFPILCFTSSGIRHLEGDTPNWEELDSTMSYMKYLLSAEQLPNEVVMLIDGRKPNQSHLIKQILERLSSSDSPLKCHTLFLLKSSHLAQLSSLTFYFSNKKTKLTTPELKEKINIVSLKEKEDLYQHIPPELLTEEFGGSMNYDHRQWIKNAVLYEKIQKLRGKILGKFPDVRDGLNEFEPPQTVRDAERLMQQHLKLKEFFVNLFAEIDVLIDELTETLLAKSSPSSESSQATLPAEVAAVGTLPSADVLAYLNKTNEEVREEQAEFDKFWASHKQRLDHMMKICHYKRSVEKVRSLMQGHIDDLTNDEVTIGDSLEASLELGEKHENFVSTCKEKMDGHLKDIREESVELCNLPDANESTKKVLSQCAEGVKEGASELTELYQKLMKLCQQKRDLFIVAVKFNMTARQCDQWCASVKEFTEYPPSADSTSAERASELIDQTDALMKQMSQKNLNTLKELGICLPEKDVKKPVSKTISKCKTNREKLEQYKNKLLQIVALSYTPPTPPQSTNRVLEMANSLTSSSHSIHSVETPTAPEDTQSLGSLASDKVDGSMGLNDYTDEESDPSVLRKREFVYKEIVSTEKDYIEDLKIILDSYYYEMDPEDRVPLRLRGKRGVVFGNLESIFQFHNDVFLKHVELYSEHPERIGTCFTQHSKEFQMYAEYCRNRPNSEALLVESPECQSFFKEIQIRLAHQLPLNSYLIKPIQRITKYQLLLKDMLKYSSNAGQALSDLQTALKMMLQALRNLNDSLHVVGLKGFPGALAEQGRLLVHDPFQVWEGAENSRKLLSRNHERHVFLFEKVVIFSKKKENPNQQRKDNKSESYFYKAHLHLTDIQVKELPDDGPLVFGLALIGRNHLYRLQASRRDVKEMWVSELRRLLSNQFKLLTDIVLKSGTLDRAAAEKFAKLRGKGKSRIFSDPMPRELEQKKSFSERFKLNILPKKKATLTATSSDNEIKRHSHVLTNKMSAPITSSLGGNVRMKIMDDDALTTSVPATNMHQLKGRTKSHDDLLDNFGPEDLQDEDELHPGGRGQEDEWSNDEEEEATTPVASTGADHYEILAPGTPCLYVATADYNPSHEDNGIPLAKGQEVELIGVNQYSGWWWVRSSNYYSNESVEGWVPASFLQMSSFN